MRITSSKDRYEKFNLNKNFIHNLPLQNVVSGDNVGTYKEGLGP